MDQWLRSLSLRTGPVQLDALEQMAGEAGLAVRPDRNRPGATLREAAERLGVVGLEEERNGPVWWVLSWAKCDRKRYPAAADVKVDWLHEVMSVRIRDGSFPDRRGLGLVPGGFTCQPHARDHFLHAASLIC